MCADRSEWFTKARFGMFIHWGVYALIGRGEWVRSDEEISAEAYEPWVRAFQPKHFDAHAWAKAAREAGMQYVVFTAKHHDGYCLFDSALTEYTSMHYAGRDYVREVLDAFRAEGLRVGLYYSLLDWHHPDYPHYGDRHHPCRNDPRESNENRDFERYLTYMHGQIRELCTNYGTIDLLWTDFSYDDLRAEAWHGEELVSMIRRLQPGILLNNRLEVSGEGFGSLLDEKPAVTAGDFVSPEQIIPPDGIRNWCGEAVPWEACVTMNNGWGYTEKDHWFKPADMLVRKLVECVSKGGNLLLNVGPDGEGRFPPESARILEEIGAWMKHSGESIVGCGYSGLPKPEYGRITAKEDCLYYHVMEAQIGGIPLRGISRETIEEITLLKDGRKMEIEDTWITGNYPDLVFVSFGEDPRLPDAIDTVIKVKRKKNKQ